MKNITPEFRRKLYSRNKQFLAFADITLNDNVVIANRTQLHLTNSEIWANGFSCEQAVSDDNAFTALGSVIMGSATLIINNIEDNYSTYDFTNAEVVLEVGLEVLPNQVQKIKLGTYRVDEPTYNGGTIRLSLLDYMEQFDRPYVHNITYPNTLLNILNDVCLNCGVTLDTLNFPHKNLTVAEPKLKNETTFREIVSWIATIAGCYAHCNVNGHLELSWFDISVLTELDNLDGGVFDKKPLYTQGNRIDGGTFSPWNIGFEADGGNFSDYSQPTIDGGELNELSKYTSGVVADGGKFNPWNLGYEADGGGFSDVRPYHLMQHLKTQNIHVDDTVITGISIVVENEEKPTTLGKTSPRTVNGKTFVKDVQENNTIYTYGSEGYIIEVKDNEFITHTNVVGSNDDGIVFWLGDQLIGLTFRKATLTQIADPSIDAGDVARVVDRKQNEYNILVTRATFAIGRYQTIVCGSETPLRNSGKRFSEATKNYVKSKKLLRTEQTEREQAYEELETALNSTGLFASDYTDPLTGAKTYYLHNRPLKENSNIIWKMTSEAFGVTNNWDEEHPEQVVWNAGLTASGTAIVQRLSAEGIDATWVTAGTLQSPLLNPSNPNSKRNFMLSLTDGNMKLGYNSSLDTYNFIVDSNGNLDSHGSISSIDGVKKTVLDNCRLRGYYKSGNNYVSMGYMDLVASVSGEYDTVFGSGSDLRFEAKTGKQIQFNKTSGGYGTTPTPLSYIDTTDGRYHGNVSGNLYGDVEGYNGNNQTGFLRMNVPYEDSRRDVELKSFRYLHLMGINRVTVNIGNSELEVGYFDANGLHCPIDTNYFYNGLTGWYALGDMRVYVHNGLIEQII